MRERITGALKQAMLSQNKREMATLRLIQAAIKDRDISARTHGADRIDDAAILELMTKLIKQREESARIYEEAGRIETAAQEREEIEIIRAFLPAQLDEAAAIEACTTAIADVGAQGLRDMGKTIALLKERHAGQMDFARASKIIKDLLSHNS